MTMPIIAKADSDNFEKAPTGTVQAVCTFIHDIGHQPGEYQGRPNVRHQIIVSWELSEKMTQGEYAGKPFMVSKYYTLSLSEKSNLRKDLENWRGKAFTAEELAGFDVEAIKNANCLLSITETENGKRKVSGVAALPKGMAPIEASQILPSPKFMEWIEKERAKAVHPSATTEEAPTENGDKDDLPF